MREWNSAQVRDMLRVYLEANDLTQKAFAEKIGVSPPYVNDILLGKREPQGKVLEFLKLARVVVYRRAQTVKGDA